MLQHPEHGRVSSCMCREGGNAAVLLKDGTALCCRPEDFAEVCPAREWVRQQCLDSVD